MKVAVLMGGRSAEREVSLMSGEGVLKALRAKGVDAYAFDPAERDLAELKRGGFERCFISGLRAGDEDIRNGEGHGHCPKTMMRQVRRRSRRVPVSQIVVPE